MTESQQIDRLITQKFSEPTAELLAADQSAHLKYLRRLKAGLSAKTIRRKKKRI